MAAVKEFSVVAEDRVGALAEVTKDLAFEGINIRGIVVVSQGEGAGEIRFVVDDSIRAQRVLSEEGVSYKTSTVLAVETINAPGSLYELAKLLADSNLNIDYVYTLQPKSSKAIIIVKVQQSEEATAVLKEAGLDVLSEDDL